MAFNQDLWDKESNLTPTWGERGTPETSLSAPTSEQPAEWSDIPKAFMSSVEGQVGDVAGYLGYHDTADAWKQSGQDWYKSITPAGQQETEAPFFSATTLEHPIQKLGMGVAKQGAWLAPALIPGGGVTSMLARGALGAALGYTGAYGGIGDAIKNTSDSELQSKSPTYLEMRKTMTEYDAKQALQDQAWDNMGVGEKAAILGTSALAGEAGPLRTVVGGGSLGKLAEGQIARRVIGATETGGVMGAQYAGTAIPSRDALTSVGAPADTMGQIAQGTLEAVGQGAVIGGVFSRGGAHREPKGGEFQTGVEPERQPGEAAGGVTVVPDGQPEPAAAQALRSATTQPPTPQPVQGPTGQPTTQGDLGFPQQRPPPGGQFGGVPRLAPGSLGQLPPEPRGPYQPALPLNYDRPPSATPGPDATPPPIPPRQPPPFTIPPAGTQRPLGLPEGVAQPPQAQLELPMPPGQRPGPPQADLGLTTPRQPLVQLGLHGIGEDVVHAPGEDVPRPPEAGPPKPPPEEPPPPPPAAAAPKGPKAKVTKVSEPEPAEAAAEPLKPEDAHALKGRIQEVVDAHPTPISPDDDKPGTLRGRKAIQARAASIDDRITAEDKKDALSLPKEENPIKQYIVHSNILANAKVPTESQVRNFLNAEKQVRDHLGRGGEEPPEEPPAPPKPSKPKPVPGGAKATEPTEPTAPPKKPPKAAAAVATSTAKEAPTAPATKKTVKIVGGKAVLTEIPTKGEAPAEPPTKPAMTPAQEAKLMAKAPVDKARIRTPTAEQFKNLLEQGRIRPASLDDVLGTHTKLPLFRHPNTKQWYIRVRDDEIPTKGRPAPTFEGEPVAGEPGVTVHPPSDARLGGIKPSDEAKAAAAEFPPKSEAAAPLPTKKTIKVIGGKAQLVNIEDKTAAIEEAKQNVHPNPTDAQKEAGNYPQGHPPTSATQGQKVTVTSPAGKEGEAEGRIAGTSKNVPAEPLETLISAIGAPDKFHVINKVNPDGGFGGHIAVQGATNASTAFHTYTTKLGRDEPALDAQQKMDRIQGITEMTPKEFEHFKQTRNPNEPIYPSTEGQHPFGKVETSKGTFDTMGSNTAKGALEQALRDLPNEPKYSIYRKLAEQVMKYLPDVPVYYLKSSDLQKVSPRAAALYNIQRNHILMGDKPVDNYPHQVTLLHELMHASMDHLYTTNKNFRNAIDAIYAEYRTKLPGDEQTPFDIRMSGVREFIAELANPVLQRQLARIQMSDSLAGGLDMNAWAKGTKTLWGATVKAFKDGLEALGIKIPGKDDASKHTLLDGMLRMSDEAFRIRSEHARTPIGEVTRALNEHNRNLETTREKAQDTQESVYDTVHQAVEHPESVQAHYESERQKLSDRITDLVDRAPTSTVMTKMYDWVVPFKGSDTLRMDTEGLFGAKTEQNDYRKLGETNLKRDRAYFVRSDKVDQAVADMYKEFRAHSRAAVQAFTDMLGDATAYRFDPRYKIGEKTNEWIGKAGWQWRNEAKLASAQADKLTRQYNALPPALKSRFGKLVDAFHEAGIEQANKATNEMIDSITRAGPKFLQELPATPDAKTRDRQLYIKFHNDWEQNWDTNQAKLKEHILNGELTENEERWLAERGFKDINDIKNLANPRGPYVPLDHGGRFIINARMKIDKPTNGKLVDGTDNVFEFKNEADADAFLKKQPPNSKLHSVYFNDEGKEAAKWDTWQNKDGTVGHAKDNQAWRVEVNNKYFSGHEGMGAAMKRYRLLKASGKFTNVSEPQSKQSGWYAGLQVSSPLFQHLMSEVDKRTDYSEGQKTAVKNLLKDTALSSLEGNRIAKHMLPRESVAGWDTDYIKSFRDYMYAHNALMVRSEFAKDTRDATNAMIKYARDHEGEKGGTERSLVLDELNKRDNFFGSPNFLGEETGGIMGRISRYAEAASFFWHMVSPGHLISHQTHQFLTYDMLAAKYGPLKAMAMANRMHGLMAGAGFKNITRSIPEMIRILKDKGKGLDYVDDLMDKVGQHPKYGADLTRMLQQAIDTNRLHPDQGFDSSVLHMGSGKIDRGIARLDLASRQTMAAAEAYNKVWGYSVGYALARDAGETHEQAMRSAFDNVSRTQGLMSRSNMSSVMNKWYMHAPMQFKGWGINMMFNLAKQIHNIFAPDAPGVRAEAVRRLLYLFGSTAALTGINGMPSDFMRVGLALAGALDLTDYNWGDAQVAMREWFTEKTGSAAIANFLMNGFLGSLGPFSFYGADRIGFGSLLVYGEPDSYSKGDLMDWFTGLLGGAPFQDLKVGAGIQAIKDGDYYKATQSFMPLKIVNDWVKAWEGATVGFPTKTGAPGMTPYSPGETFMQGIGLTPIRKQLWGEARQAEYREMKSTRDETTQLLDALGRATTGPDRIKAQTQIAAFNLRNPDARITPQDIARAQRRQTAPAILGYTVTKRNQAKLQMLQQSYGF